MITGAAFHTVIQQAFDQTDRLKRITMLDCIVEMGKPHIEELKAGLDNIGLLRAGPDLSGLPLMDLR